MRLILHSPAPDETVRIGRLLGEALRGGELILLSGDLGAGKSLLARGIAAGLQVSPHTPVTSPTYTIVNSYEGRLPFHHVDLYRLQGPESLEAVGFHDLFDGESVVVVEWPERGEGEFPPDSLLISLEQQGESERSILVTSRGDSSTALLERFQKLFDRVD